MGQLIIDFIGMILMWFGLLALFTLLIIGSVFYLLGYSDLGEDIVE